MKFGQVVGLFADGKPVVVRELDQDSIAVAIVDDVQAGRFVV